MTYRIMSMTAEGDTSIEDVVSARAAYNLGCELINAGHTDILVITPDDRYFLFGEYAALSGYALPSSPE